MQYISDIELAKNSNLFFSQKKNQKNCFYQKNITFVKSISHNKDNE
jgi:hypothetical protein